MITPGLASVARRAGAGLLLGLVMTSCGASEGAEPEPDPGPARPHQGSGVAADRFDGLFSVTTLELDGRAESPIEPIVFEIDVEFGDLTIDTTCGTLLGSFSFFDDGEAGITIAGRSVKTCTSEAEAQTGRLLTILDRVTGWTAGATSIDLVGSDGNQLSLLG